MKITYLKICNYKSIEQLEITDIENALILVGKNNTGKTAVIDAILLAMGMRNCAEHEFLDAGKPISISVHIEYSESDIMLLHSRSVLCKVKDYERWLADFQSKMVFCHLLLSSHQIWQHDIPMDFQSITNISRKYCPKFIILTKTEISRRCRMMYSVSMTKNLFRN